MKCKTFTITTDEIKEHLIKSFDEFSQTDVGTLVVNDTATEMGKELMGGFLKVVSKEDILGIIITSFLQQVTEAAKQAKL